MNDKERISRDNYLFSGNREAALIRDGYKCRKCGMTRKEHKKKWGKDITVDHIDGNGSGKKKKDRNDSLSNLQTLCLRCHGTKDGNNPKMPDIKCLCGKVFHPKRSITLYCSVSCGAKSRKRDSLGNYLPTPGSPWVKNQQEASHG